ncbi:hypothetical protein ABPG77_006573 [Micractinium sp. CCAP 211/92]
MAPCSTSAFRPVRCTVTRSNAQKITLRPRWQAVTAADSGAASRRHNTEPHPAAAIAQHSQVPPPLPHAQAFCDSMSLHRTPSALSAGSKTRPRIATAASAAPAAPAVHLESQTAHPCQQEYTTAGWASVAPSMLRQKALSMSCKNRRAAPVTGEAPCSCPGSTADGSSAANVGASPTLRSNSLLAAASQLRASYPATFDALSAATRTTLDDHSAAQAWLCHLLAAHGEPLSLLALGGVTALVATDAGLLSFIEVAADAADSLQRAGRHSEALTTAVAGLQLVCCLRFGRGAGRGPFLPAIRALQRVVEAAAC